MYVGVRKGGIQTRVFDQYPTATRKRSARETRMRIVGDKYRNRFYLCATLRIGACCAAGIFSQKQMTRLT